MSPREPVESDKEGIICDRLDEYVLLIANLLKDENKLQEMGENAKQFAKKYDYRLLYSSYHDLIENQL